jgi:hypothetical protein
MITGIAKWRQSQKKEEKKKKQLYMIETPLTP